jgi:GNAT superfamily N-acetyltransferase/N-acetylglutamate synthase-like GNAT family acetyltransferase
LVEIRLLKHSEEKEKLLNLFRVSFGFSISVEHWDWKHLQNPLAFSDPELIVAVDGGKIVGARPFLPAEMWLGNKKIKAAQHCDTMVHPDYQGRGVFNRMGQFAMRYLKDRGYALSYGFPGPLSRPGFLKQGYRIVAETENLFRICHPQKLLSYKLRSKTLAGVLGFSYDILLNTGMKRTTRLPDSVQVEVLDRFADDLKGVDDLRDKSGINLVRSESYLRWRFDRYPDHTYKYVIAKKEGELWGYAVTSVQQQLNGLVHGMIVDYLVRDKDIGCFRALVDGCLGELSKSKFDIILVWTFSEPKFREELLKYFGFKSSTRFPYSKLSDYAYLDAILIDEKLAGAIDIYDKNNWRVTHAYPDFT